MTFMSRDIYVDVYVDNACKPGDQMEFEIQMFPKEADSPAPDLSDLSGFPDISSFLTGNDEQKQETKPANDTDSGNQMMCYDVFMT